MIVEGGSFLNGPPDNVFLMRAELHFCGGSDQLKVGAVIAGRHMRIEAVIIQSGKAHPPVVIRPYPVHKGLPDFIGLLHGSRRQLLIQLQNRPALFIPLAGILLHLDGLVHEQGFDNPACRIFGNTPDAGIQGSVGNAHMRIPPTERRQIFHALKAVPAMQMFNECGYHVRRQPG